MKALAESDNENVRQRVKLEKACDGGLPSVWADGEQVCLAFHNILSYAVAAAPENEGAVVCRIRPLDDGGGAAPTGQPPLAPRVVMGMSLPSIGPLAHEMGMATGLPPSLELFLAQRIIEKNNGSLSFGPSANAGTLVIALPATPQERG
jgi:nitrogen-specific signal transduction histidine kinase